MPTLAKGLNKAALIERIEELEQLVADLSSVSTDEVDELKAEVTRLEHAAERDTAMYEKDNEKLENQIFALEVANEHLACENRWLTSDLAKAHSTICQLEAR